MKCPVCVDVDLSISSREGVEIDFCPQCRGVWLDRGELDKIIDRVAATPGGAAPSPAPVPSYDDRSRYDDRDRRDDRPRYDDRDQRMSEKDLKKRKRRGFLDDLFDFD